MGPLQDDSWVFEGYGVLLRGLIKGFTASLPGLYCFSDSSDSCDFTKILLLLFIVAF